MTRLAGIALTLVLLGGTAAAQTPAAPAPAARIPRAKGPPLALAVEAAQSAVIACLANGYKVTALVADSGGVPVALLSGDGAGARTIDVAASKAAVVLKYKTASGVIVERAKTDAALAAELTADPKIGVARQGALPIIAGGELIGAFAVSGAPGGDKDEACVKIGLDKITGRLK